MQARMKTKNQKRVQAGAREKSPFVPAGRARKPTYLKPGPVGGILIRELIRFLRHEGVLERGQTFPRLLIACSGGSDSTALAVLVARYGRKIVAPEKLTLVHANHGWRGEASEEDSRFVGRLAKRLEVGSIRFKARALPKPGESWEAVGRAFRKRVYRRAIVRTLAKYILTGHTRDDQFETRIWRFLTGARPSLRFGILPRHRRELRPFLNVQKEQLREFLREEKIEWREDGSNADPRFLRNRMRLELLPAIFRLFPAARESVTAAKVARPAMKKLRKRAFGPVTENVAARFASKISVK